MDDIERHVLPVFTAVEVELVRRTTPVFRLDIALKSFQSHEVDYSLRRDCVILQPPDGQIVAFETGRVVFRFRGKPIEESFKWVSRVLGRIFGAFGFEEKEPLSLSLDAVFVVPSEHDPVSFLGFEEVPKKFAVLLDSIRTEVGASQLGFHGYGVVLFLTPLENDELRVQIRVEPALSEPHSKFFVDFSYYRRRLSLKEIDSLGREVNKYGVAIFKSLGG